MYTKKNNLLIIGAGGHGRVVADIALKMNRWENISFLDDNDNIKPFMNISVIGKPYEWVNYIDDYDIFVAVGNNKNRKEFLLHLEKKGASIPIIIHPSAIISEKVIIDAGTAIMAGTVINCCTSIGKGCIINTGATIDHDNNIGDFVHISPGVHLAGNVQIGKCTWVGIGATISNKIHVTDNCMIGAGAVVVSNIEKAGIYIGIPARRMCDG